VVVRLLAAALVLSAGALLTGCEDETPPGTPTPATATIEELGEPDGDLKATEAARPTPTPIPASADCPDGTNTEAACEAGVRMLRELQGRAADFLVSVTEPVTVACGGANDISTEIICQGVPAGETRRGLVYANKVYLVLPEEQYRERVASFPWSDARIVGLACPESGDGGLDCSEWFLLGLDLLPSEPIENPRYSALLVRWNGSNPAVRAHFLGLYTGLAPAFGGPESYPLKPADATLGDTISVRWQPWRP
jgi:hypothetical protein